MGRLEKFKLFYEQVPSPRRNLKVLRRKVSKKPQTPVNVLENVNR